MLTAQLLDRSKEAHENKKHDEAIRLLSTALLRPQLDTETRLTALDLRCQAYSKLGKHELALQDARHMIHISSKLSSTGFLRCSQIERYRGNYDAAMKWLQHGIRHIPKCQPIFDEQFRKVRRLADHQIAERKRQDPISSVPLEILQLILAYFTYRHLVRLLRVSKTWKSLLCRLTPLTTSIDFSDARRTVSSQSCHVAIRRLCPQPREIILGSLSQSANKVMQVWLTMPNHLEHLEVLHIADTPLFVPMSRLTRLKKIKSFSIRTCKDVGFATLFNFTAECSTLERACIIGGVFAQNLPVRPTPQTQLRQLELKFSCNTAAQFLTLEHFPNLRMLSIDGPSAINQVLDLTKHRHLRRLCLNEYANDLFTVKMPDQLEELAIIKESSSSAVSISDLRDPLDLPELHTLSLVGLWSYPVMEALSNSAVPPKLLNVNLFHVPQRFWSDGTALSAAHQVTKDCRKLVFASQTLVNEDIRSFVAFFPAIEKLELEAPMITGVFLSDFVKRPDCRLKSITLRNCSKVSSDIHTWLQSQRIACQILNTDNDVKFYSRVREAW